MDGLMAFVLSPAPPLDTRGIAEKKNLIEKEKSGVWMSGHCQLSKWLSSVLPSSPIGQN